MLRIISHLFNAAVFMSLAGLAWNIGAARFGQAEARNNLASLVRQLAGADAKAAAPGAPGSTAALPAATLMASPASPSEPPAKAMIKDAAELPAFAPSGFAQSTTLPPPAPLVSANPQNSVALPVAAPEPQGTKARDRTETMAAKPDQSDAKSGMAAAETTKPVDTRKPQSPAAAGLPSTIPPRTEKKAEGDVIVPPIRRQNPAGAQAIARLGQKPLNGNGKDAPSSTKAAKRTAKGTSVRAANSAAGAAKKRIDAAGRSSLGVADQPITAGSGQGNCNQGLRFDVRSSRCVPLPSPTAATPLRVRGAP